MVLRQVAISTGASSQTPQGCVIPATSRVWSAECPTSGSDSATTDSAKDSVSDRTCTADLIARPRESCTYPGTSTEFLVDSNGTGRFLFVSAGSTIELRNTTINGVTYTFVASKQSDGNWLVEEVG